MLKWPGKKNQEQKPAPFDAKVVVDESTIKIVGATLNGKPCFFGVGTVEEEGKKVKAEGSVTELSGKGEYEAAKKWNWQILYNPANMPGFVTLEDFKQTMSTITATVSASALPKLEPTPLTQDTPIGTNLMLSPTKGLVRVSGTAGVSLAATVVVKNPDGSNDAKSDASESS